MSRQKLNVLIVLTIIGAIAGLIVGLTNSLAVLLAIIIFALCGFLLPFLWDSIKKCWSFFEWIDLSDVDIFNGKFWGDLFFKLLLMYFCLALVGPFLLLYYTFIGVKAIVTQDIEDDY
jgi:hypothetical protein